MKNKKIWISLIGIAVILVSLSVFFLRYYGSDISFQIIREENGKAQEVFRIVKDKKLKIFPTNKWSIWQADWQVGEKLKFKRLDQDSNLQVTVVEHNNLPEARIYNKATRELTIINPNRGIEKTKR